MTDYQKYDLILGVVLLIVMLINIGLQAWAWIF